MKKSITIFFALASVAASVWAVNARVNLPETTFTCSKVNAAPGLGFIILIEAPVCKSFAFDVGPAGNAHLTCIQ